MSSSISTWMIQDIILVDENKSIQDICILMDQKNQDAVVVCKGKRPVGIFTDRDLVDKVIAKERDPKYTLLKDVMTTDIKVASPSVNYKEIYDLMISNNIRHLPVVENNEVIGMVCIKDLLRFNMRTMERTVGEQKKEIEFIKNMLDETNDERNRRLYMENLRLQSLIRVDDLTGLYNHKYFEEILVKELARSKRYNRSLTLLFLDLDYFKHYNDINGHEAGNIVLKQFADILRNTSRQSDTAFKMAAIDIVARYGGEEFVIVLPETDRSGGFARAERVLNDVRNFPFHNRESQPNGRLTVSIGVSEYPADASDWNELIKRADESLYRAKNNGRDRVM